MMMLTCLLDITAAFKNETIVDADTHIWEQQ
jgi:hypothetical protein